MIDSAEQLNMKKPQEQEGVEKKPDDLETKSENGTETPEDLEKLVQEKIESAEKELEELGGSEKRIDGCNNNVNLPIDKVAEIKAATGVVEKLEAINEKSKSLKEAFKEKMRILLAGAMIATGSMDANIAKASVNSKVKSESKIEEVVNSQDKGRENAEAYDNKMAELRKSVLMDDHEKIVIISEKNGNLEFLENSEKNNSKNSGIVEAGIIENAFKNGSGKIAIIHTHPLEVYSNYSKEEIEKIRRGELEPNPMPPSSTDISGLIQERNLLKTDSSRIENKIIDPTGEWNIKLDENNAFIKKYGDLMNYAENFREGDFAIKELGLSEEELKNLRSKKNQLEDVHPELRLNILDSDPSTKGTAEKIRKKFAQKTEEIFSNNEMADFEKIFSNEANIITNRKNTKAEKAVFIDKLVDKFKKYGVIVTYKPFEDKK